MLSAPMTFQFSSILTSDVLQDVLIPSTCPTIHPFKIIVFLFSSILFSAGCNRLKSNQMPFWENWKVTFFTILIMNSIFSTQMFVEKDGMYETIQGRCPFYSISDLKFLILKFVTKMSIFEQNVNFSTKLFGNI